MKYGLVCISNLLRKQNPDLTFKTMTRSCFLKKNRQDAILELSRRISHNITVSIETIKFCKSIGIKGYRLSCKIFPLITDSTLNLSVDLLPNYSSILENLKLLGRTANQLNIKISIHPDQFVVLGSQSEQVKLKSINELNFYSWILDACGLPQDYSCPINIHPSFSKFKSPEDFMADFMGSFFKCDYGVKSRLVVENEDKGFWNCSKLYEYFYSYCKYNYKFHFPLTLDNLHDKCNPSFNSKGEIIDYKDWFLKFHSTWPIEPVFHWSESDDNSLKHSKKIKNTPPYYGLDCLYEVECKDKDEGFFHLLEKKS